MDSEILPKLEHTFDKKITPKRKELVNKKTPKNDIKKFSKKMKKKEPKRCQHKDCRKRLGIVKINCKCELFFCPNHRPPESHSCNYDYKANNKISKELLDGNSNFIKVNKI